MKARISTLMLSAGCLGVLAGCHFDMDFSQGVDGSGKAISESKTVGSFTKIREDGAANLYVKVGPSTSVKVEGDDNIVPMVKCTVEDGTLVIKTKGNFHPKTKLLVTV